MSLARRLVIASLTFIVGILAASGSAHLGRRTWPPRVFALRNPFKAQPIIENQPNCPLHVTEPRFYSYVSLASGTRSLLRFEVKNVSNRPVHSFTLSFRSSDPLDTGAIGVQPEALWPASSQVTDIDSRGKDRMTISIDFVQFADGDVWYAEPLKATVKPEGVRAGAQAAFNHLRTVLESGGAPAVMAALPTIRADINFPDFSSNGAFGDFGFYCGVTNVEVRVQRAYQEGRLGGVEALLKESLKQTP